MMKTFSSLSWRNVWLVALGGLTLLANACTQPMTTTQTPTTTPAAHSAHDAHSPVAAQSPAVTATPRVPDYHADLAAARPLPKTLPPEQFTAPHVQAAYRIAQRYPDVLAQQPCYCYCDTGHGHKSLLDCHFDAHSSECMVCLKEALLAGKLHLEGKSAEQIRAAIVRGDWQGVQIQ